MSNGNDPYPWFMTKPKRPRRFIEPDASRRPMYDPREFEQEVERAANRQFPPGSEEEMMQRGFEDPAVRRARRDAGGSRQFPIGSEEWAWQRQMEEDTRQSHLRGKEQEFKEHPLKYMFGHIFDPGDPGEMSGAQIASDIGVGFHPVTGPAQGFRDIGRIADPEYRERMNWWDYPLHALGAIPVAGGLRKIGQYAPEVQKTLRTLRPSRTGKVTEALEPVMRGMGPEDALQAARDGVHLRPGSGKYAVGGPENVKSLRHLNTQRDNFDRLVEQGAGGRTWYQRARAWVSEAARGDPQRSRNIAEELALTSEEASPGPNLGFAVQGRNALATGADVPNIKTSGQTRRFTSAREAGEPISLGFKTEPFSFGLDPLGPRQPHIAVNDIWHARAWGYTMPKTGKPWDAGLSTTQHAFLDGENLLAAERANVKKLGGHTDWTPEDIQAAAWVAIKAEEKAAEMKWPMEKALAWARKTYPDYLDRQTAFATHEFQPAPALSETHLPGTVGEGAGRLRQEYAELPGSSWRSPEGGGDVLYNEIDWLTRPTTPMQGVYKGELNPGEVARPLVARTADPGKEGFGKVLSPHEMAGMNMVETFRAFVDAQEMGAHHFPIVGMGERAGASNLLRIGFEAAPTGQQMRDLQQLAENNGFWLSHTGDGFSFIPSPKSVSGKELTTRIRGKKAVKAKKATPKRAAVEAEPAIPSLRAEIQNILGDVEVEKGVSGSSRQDPIDDAAVWFGDLWNQEDSGAVTDMFLARMEELRPQAPETYRRLMERNPRIAQAVEAKRARDAGLPPEYGAPRQDIQNMRKVIAERGAGGLRRAREMNYPLPVVAGLGLGTAAYSREQVKKRQRGGV